jgi:putative ABC transport system permease protein
MIPPVPELSEALELSLVDVGIAAVLVILAGVISLLMRLKLEVRLGIAAVRTVIQLLLVGYILRWVFAIDNYLLVLGVAVIMVALASRAAVARPRFKFSGVTIFAFLSLVTSGFLTAFTVTAVIIKISPWYNPQYLIPLVGMILGNGLTGLSLCLDQLLETLKERRQEVEMELALGATRWEAARGPLSDAVRRGMIPIINSMTVVGIVSLPGMMTGQILQGADPLNAVKYQIVVMFMIAAATALSSIVIALLVFRRLFNSKHQLRADLIQKKPE